MRRAVVSLEQYLRATSLPLFAVALLSACAGSAEKPSHGDGGGELED